LTQVVKGNLHSQDTDGNPFQSKRPKSLAHVLLVVAIWQPNTLSPTCAPSSIVLSMLCLMIPF